MSTSFVLNYCICGYKYLFHWEVKNIFPEKILWVRPFDPLSRSELITSDSFYEDSKIFQKSADNKTNIFVLTFLLILVLCTQTQIVNVPLYMSCLFCSSLVVFLFLRHTIFWPFQTKLISLAFIPHNHKLLCSPNHTEPHKTYKYEIIACLFWDFPSHWHCWISI